MTKFLYCSCMSGSGWVITDRTVRIQFIDYLSYTIKYCCLKPADMLQDTIHQGLGIVRWHTFDIFIMPISHHVPQTEMIMSQTQYTSHSLILYVPTWPSSGRQLAVLLSLCNENQPDALFIFNLFCHSTATCFGYVYCPSSGGIHCICTAVGTHYTFKLTGSWLLSRSGQLPVNLKRVTHTNFCTYTVYTSWWWAVNMPKTCSGTASKT
jgi:hypothetical protein